MDVSIFNDAINLWASLNLPKVQKDLDENILSVENLKTESLESRKLLAGETKRFKKLEDSEKLNQFTKLVKQYQKEVDSLTARAKFSEDALLELYAKLSEAPDPKPLLEVSVDQVQSQVETSALKTKLAELEERLAKCADYDTLKARLLTIEQNSAQTLAKRLQAKETEINFVWEERERNWSDREKELARQLELLKSSNKILENKIAQPADGSGTSIADAEKVHAQHDILLQELNAAQVRIMELQGRNEELSGSLAKANAEMENGSELSSKNSKISALESENAFLSASLERETSLLKTQLTSQEQNARIVNSQLASLKSESETLKRKLNNYADYEDLKKELIAMKKIEFGTSDDEGEDVDSSLKAANKKLQSNLAELRGRMHDVEQKRVAAVKENEGLKARTKELEALNSKLELDLEKVDDVSRMSDTASIMSGATRQLNRVGAAGRPGTGKLSPTSSIVGIPEDDEPVLPQSNSSILPIVTQQRDRFRTKNMDLERQLRSFALEKTNMKSELAKMKANNERLYERIRFLSSYDSQQRGSSFDGEAQFNRSYEESLHPLAEFKQRELDRYKKKQMTPLEKLFLSFARIILASKTSRMLFMFYCLGLHGLMMAMCLYVASFSGYMTPDVGVVQTSKSELKGLGNI
ncbi:LAMI_0G08174g1_1 [Lachancea mirantina]|uniref:Protein CASP n=1 Tax=Lachancea mirantina TaxID=1230905 RepID=A0A1G4K9S8_9SACH|nr:LAMI_0G08174g1_1 [Lachancea mirantina]